MDKSEGMSGASLRLTSLFISYPSAESLWYQISLSICSCGDKSGFYFTTQIFMWGTHAPFKSYCYCFFILKSCEKKVQLGCLVALLHGFRTFLMCWIFSWFMWYNKQLHFATNYPCNVKVSPTFGGFQRTAKDSKFMALKEL